MVLLEPGRTDFSGLLPAPPFPFQPTDGGQQRHCPHPDLGFGDGDDIAEDKLAGGQDPGAIERAAHVEIDLRQLPGGQRARVGAEIDAPVGARVCGALPACDDEFLPARPSDPVARVEDEVARGGVRPEINGGIGGKRERPQVLGVAGAAAGEESAAGQDEPGRVPYLVVCPEA